MLARFFGPAVAGAIALGGVGCSGSEDSRANAAAGGSAGQQADGPSGDTSPEADALSGDRFSKRYVLFRGDLREGAEVGPVGKKKLVIEQLEALIEKAAANGYNGIVLGANGVQYLQYEKQGFGPSYVASFERIRQKAAQHGIALIPYSFTSRDASLRKYIEDPGATLSQQIATEDEVAEALPVEGTQLLVNLDASVATVPASAIELLANPGFDGASKTQPPPGWHIDGWGTGTTVDGASIRVSNDGKRIRFIQNVQVTQRRSYALSVEIRSEALTKHPSSLRFYVIRSDVDGEVPLYANRSHGLGFGADAKENLIQPEQPLTKYTVYFDSLDSTEVQVLFDLGDSSDLGEGKLWFDNASLREVGLEHVSSREPLIVTSLDHEQTYVAGKDYVFDSPGQLSIPSTSSVQPGEKLSASYFMRGDVDAKHPPASVCRQATWDIHTEASRHLDDLFGRPAGFAIDYEEWRVAGWDPACQVLGIQNGGQYLAHAIDRAQSSLRQINPSYELFVWSDMFSPHENAKSRYFMVNGDLSGSWKGLSNQTYVMTWADRNATARRMLQQLVFFSGLDQPQIVAGYYDDDLDADDNNVTRWLEALDAAEAAGAERIEGFMYTTWQDPYLEYEDLGRVADILRSAGRWVD